MDKFSDDHIWEIIQNAKMTDYIEKMPNGLQTQIETDGLGLSNGEKQVISCLRGLLGIYCPFLDINFLRSNSEHSIISRNLFSYLKS